MKSTPEIFFSYAWGDDNEKGESREKLVNELYQSLIEDGCQVIRDKADLGYKGFISDFMGKIGQGKCVVVAISRKYFKSPYCMFELYEIARNSNFDKHQFREKVLPVMVEFIDFTNPVIIDEHFSFWENEYNKWDALVKKRSGQLSVEQMQRFDKIKMIHQNFGKLTDWIIDMNTLSPKILSQDNFAEIKKAIQTRVVNVSDNDINLKIQVENAGTRKTPTSNSGSYKLPNIRKFLDNALNDTELNTLCMDHFPDVYNRFTDGQNKLQKINLLLDYCRRNIQFNTLLDAMQEMNNVQFELYQPYV